MLEPLEAARARRARIYAEIVGFGMTSDAHHVTQPTVEGPAQAMRVALTDAGVDPEAVGYALSNSFAFGALNAVLAFRAG